MSVIELVNNQTGYHAWQARCGHWSKAFDVKKHGMIGAHRLAQEADKEYRLSIADNPKPHRCSNTPTKSETNGFVGIGFKIVTNKETGELMGAMWGAYTNRRGESGSFLIPYTLETVHKAVYEAQNHRCNAVFRLPPCRKVRKLARAWLVYVEAVKLSREL